MCYTCAISNELSDLHWGAITTACDLLMSVRRQPLLLKFEGKCHYYNAGYEAITRLFIELTAFEGEQLLPLLCWHPFDAISN